MLEKINEDIKNSMKNKDKERLSAIRMLKSALLENKTSKKPIAEADVAIAYVKKLKQSIESFPEGAEEIGKLNKEIEYLSDYLPKPMSKEEVEGIIKAFINETENANFGMVMKHISPIIKGKFDGREASQLVKDIMG